MPLIGKAGPFSLYSVITKLNVTGKQLFGTTVDIEADGSEAKATFFKLWSLFQKP